MHRDVAYLHVTPGTSSEHTGIYEKSSTWYFTKSMPVDGSEMDVFFVEDGAVRHDPDVDRHIHGHTARHLKEMFQKINLVAKIT